MDRPSFNKSILTKIIIAFLIALGALGASYFVNKLAFTEIKTSVNDLSFPNRKLIVVNNLFFEVNETEKSFRNLITSDKEVSLKSFLLHSNKMKVLTDSLALLCVENSYQSGLTDSVRKLLSVRERMLLKYAEFRQVVNANSSLLKQTQILDSIIVNNQGSRDSLLLSSQRRRIVTQIDSIEIKSNDKRSLWKKIFGGKPEDSVKIKRVVKSEVNTNVDTLLQTNRDSLLPQIQMAIAEMAEDQKQRRKLFLTREAKLENFENAFNSRIIQLLSEVEKDILHQTRETHYRAETIIREGIHRIYLIFLFFIVAAVIIALFLLADISRSNKYKQLLLKAKEEAEANSLARQRFLSNMSHEIRTPLQSVIGYTEQLKLQSSPDVKALDAIQLASEHLLNVINEVLDYNRIISGNFVFEQENFELNGLMNDVIAVLSYQANQKGLKLLYDESKVGNVFLKGDAFRLKQILLNLISNAIKFTNEGSVSVEMDTVVRNGQTFYSFCITDTGIGIPEAEQTIIFNRFEQSNLPASQKYAGSGLGLSIVKLLVEAQGGSISVKSKPGEGSSFFFEIPYEIGNAVDKKETAIKVTTVAVEQYVWLLDDDLMILNLCSAILNKYKIRHRIFKSATEMLEADTSPAPDIVMLDIRMPDINGIQLVDKIKHKLPATTRFIAITAQSLPEEHADILQGGFDRILLKPFTQADLLALFKQDQRPLKEGVAHKVIHELNRSLGQSLADEILAQFVIETKSDLLILENALRTVDKDQTVLLLHRIAGRSAQLGFKEVANGFRKQEILVHNLGEMNQQGIQASIDALSALLVEIETRN